MHGTLKQTHYIDSRADYRVTHQLNYSADVINMRTIIYLNTKSHIATHLILIIKG